MNITINLTEKDLQEHPEFFHILHGVVPKTMEPVSDLEETAKTDFLEKKFNLPEQQEVPAEETPAEAETDKTEEIHYSQEDVRKAVSSYAKKHSAAQAKAILMNHGASKVTDLDPAKYETVIKECEV